MTREIRITPSILNSDFDHLDQEIAKIAGVSDLIHLDVMDNIFVPNFTFDFESASAIIKGCPIGVDAHLMVSNVDEIGPRYAESPNLTKSQCNILTCNCYQPLRRQNN